MTRPGAEQRSSTRNEILQILCTSRQTVGELSRRLGITETGVRKNLDRLQEAGLVTYEPVRHGVGKPAHEYRLTPDGERSLSRAYLPLLRALLDALAEEHHPDAVERLLRAAGRQLAPPPLPPGADLRERLRSAVVFLAELGGSATLRDEPGGPEVHSTCCALGALVANRPVVCKVLEELLSEHLALPVEERCHHGERPHCRFRVPAAE